jgi:hypothetical protein
MVNRDPGPARRLARTHAQRSSDRMPVTLPSPIVTPKGGEANQDNVHV